MRLALLVLLVLALPATAHAGGWATVEMASPPAGLGAGDTWRAELVVKAHGITPTDGLVPRIRIDNGEGVVRTFTARPAGRKGTYVADVVIPQAGTWRTRILDGYTNAWPHRLAPFTVGAEGGVTAAAPPPRPSAAPAGGAGFPSPQLVAILVVALGLAAASVALREPGRARGGRRPAPRAVAGGPAAGS